jgi:hypothetical protein
MRLGRPPAQVGTEAGSQPVPGCTSSDRVGAVRPEDLARLLQACEGRDVTPGVLPVRLRHLPTARRAPAAQAPRLPGAPVARPASRSHRRMRSIRPARSGGQERARCRPSRRSGPTAAGCWWRCGCLPPGHRPGRPRPTGGETSRSSSRQPARRSAGSSQGLPTPGLGGSRGARSRRRGGRGWRQRLCRRCGVPSSATSETPPTSGSESRSASQHWSGTSETQPRSGFRSTSASQRWFGSVTSAPWPSRSAIRSRSGRDRCRSVRSRDGSPIRSRRRPRSR